MEWNPEGDLMRVEGLATGFLCCSRNMIQKMWDASDGCVADDGHEYRHIFEVKMVDGKFWGEDYLFCDKWRKLGGDVWLSVYIGLRHVGKRVWQGDFAGYMLNGQSGVAQEG